MYLSRIKPYNPYKSRYQQKNQHVIHQTIWSFFGDHADRKRDFLYRFDYRENQPTYLVLSAREPCHVDNWDIAVKPFNPVLGEGMELGFNLRVNPAVYEDGKRRDPVYLFKQHNPDWFRDMTQQQMVHHVLTDWLTKRGTTGGFLIEPSAVRVEQYHLQRFRKNGKGRDITFAGADLIGRLAITDPTAFKDTLYNGLGKCKGYGHGLMLVRRV